MNKMFFLLVLLMFPAQLNAQTYSNNDMMSCKNFKILYQRIITKDAPEDVYSKKSTPQEATKEEKQKFSVINSAISGYISGVQDITGYYIMDPRKNMSFPRLLKSVYGRCSIDENQTVLRVLVNAPFVKKAYQSLENKINKNCQQEINNIKQTYEKQQKRLKRESGTYNMGKGFYR